ncbi:MAG TPA: hypothetical protein VFR67_06770 [Pilimelia sp.]|nr:hypothetical protein [Pilimelia sp.]
MEQLQGLAARLDAAASGVAAAAAGLDHLDEGAGGFAADAPGRVGELGRLLYAQWTAALAARAREAAVAGARLAETASTLRIVEAGYADADAAAHRRLTSREG